MKLFYLFAISLTMLFCSNGLYAQEPSSILEQSTPAATTVPAVQEAQNDYFVVRTPVFNLGSRLGVRFQNFRSNVKFRANNLKVYIQTMRNYTVTNVRYFGMRAKNRAVERKVRRKMFFRSF